MQKLAEQVSISLADDKIELNRIAKPLFRFTDPARGYRDGSIWGWGRSGRPAALLVMADNENRSWLVETVSLAERAITNVDSRGLVWTSKGPGLEMKALRDVPLPSESATRRQIELKQLARRFTAYEMWDNDGKTELRRYQLRLLPQPIRRYSDPQKGILEGGIFIFNYGANPEIVMLLEATREKEKSQWNCGFGRISWAAPHVEFDGKEVWQQPKIRGSTATYLMRGMTSPD